MKWWPFRAPTQSQWKSSADTLELFKQIFGTNESSTGESITWKTALECATALACVRAIANGISQVPWKLMVESEDGRSRVPARESKLYRVLHRKPNQWQTSHDYRQTIAFHLCLCGNHYSFKNVVGGVVTELIPFEPSTISVDRLASGELEYTYRPADGSAQKIPADAMWHIRGPSWNGWMGLEGVKLARESLGLAIATEKQQARMFKNGVQASGTYSFEGKLDAAQYKQLRDWIVLNTSGANAGSPMILDRSAKWLQQSMTGVDAQTLESRKFQVEEVCRAFGVLPAVIGHSDGSEAFASVEQRFLAHVVNTLAPWYDCIEQSADVNLLSEQDYKQGYYTKFVVEGLLRGAMADTAEYLSKLVERGIMTRNEARAKLDLNWIDGMDDPLTPANMVVGFDGGGEEQIVEEVPAPVEQQPVIDVAAIAQALAQAVGSIQIPAPIVNVAAPLPIPPAPQTITVESPQITVNVPEHQPANVTVEAPQVNVAPPAVTVNMPEQPAAQVNVAAPSVTVAPPNVSVTVEKGGKLKFIEDANGTLTGAELE